MRKATNAWQKSKGHQQTDKLTEEQTSQLIQDGLKEREAVGWSMLHDPAVGFAIGVPTKLVTFGTPRIDGGTLYYYGGGTISQSVGIHHGYPTCRTMDALYPKSTAGAAFRARGDNWFVALFRRGETSSYLKVTCHHSRLDHHGDDRTGRRPWRSIAGLFAAMASSLMLTRTPDPTVRPRPRVDDLPPAPSGFSDQQAARPQAKAKAGKALAHRRLRARPARSSSRPATAPTCAPMRCSTRRRAPSTSSRPTAAWVRRWPSATTSC